MAEKAQAPAASTQAPAQDTTPIYEVGYHVVPTVGDEGVAAVVDKVRAAIGKAEIITDMFPQKVGLAYTVERATEGKREKYTEAYFGAIKFAAPREQAASLAEALRGVRDVLRSLIIETVREEIKAPAPRALYSSDRLEGQTLKKPTSAPEKAGEVSQEELDKSIDALVQE